LEIQLQGTSIILKIFWGITPFPQNLLSAPALPASHFLLDCNPNFARQKAGKEILKGILKLFTDCRMKVTNTNIVSSKTSIFSISTP